MDDEFVETELNGEKLRVFKNGTIMKYPSSVGCKASYTTWYFISQNLDKKGYCNLRVGTKKYKGHRIIAMVYLGLDITNKTIQVDHIDHCKTNNNINNLRLVNNSKNQMNLAIIAKGYSVRRGIYETSISVNNKRIYLGSFKTAEEAHQAYLNAKAIYHIIPNPHLHL